MKQGMPMESKFFRIMSRAWDVIVLNLLLLVCSLPLVTAGAAVTAVCDMSLRMLRQEEGYIVPGFFRAFRRNFGQATRLWLLCLAAAAISVGDVLAGRLAALAAVQPVLTAVAGVQLLLLAALMQYLFPLTARFANTLGATLKNSLLLAVCHLPETLLMTAVSAAPWLVLFFVPLPGKVFPCFVTLLILIGFAGGLYLNSRLIRRIFQSHFGSEEPEPEETEDTDEREELIQMQRMLALDGADGQAQAFLKQH